MRGSSGGAAAPRLRPSLRRGTSATHAPCRSPRCRTRCSARPDYARLVAGNHGSAALPACDSPASELASSAVTADAITDLPAAARAPRVGCWGRARAAARRLRPRLDEPTSPFALDCDSALAASERLLAAARGAGRPVVFATVAYDELDLQTVKMLAKTPRVKAMRAGSPVTEVDARLAPGEGELVLVKKHASAFFGTHLASFLISRGVDTLLIGGCITSGCVRATAVDAAQHGYRALVVADALRRPHGRGACREPALDRRPLRRRRHAGPGRGLPAPRLMGMQLAILGSGSAVPDPVRGNPSQAVVVDDTVAALRLRRANDGQPRACRHQPARCRRPLLHPPALGPHQRLRLLHDLDLELRPEAGAARLRARRNGGDGRVEHLRRAPRRRRLRPPLRRGVAAAHRRSSAPSRPPTAFARSTSASSGSSAASASSRARSSTISALGMPSVAYRIESPTTAWSPSAGTPAPCDSVVELARGADVLVHDAAFLDEIIEQRADVEPFRADRRRSDRPRGGRRNARAHSPRPVHEPRAAIAMARCTTATRAGPEIWDEIVARAQAQFDEPSCSAPTRSSSTSAQRPRRSRRPRVRRARSA